MWTEAGVAVSLPKNELEAWLWVNMPTARLRYEHYRTYQRRCSYRANFVKRIERDPVTRCWVWVGSFIQRDDVDTWYPMYFYHEPRVHTSRQKAAYPLLLKEWFPNLYTPQMRSSARCGNYKCISPYHRVKDYGRLLDADTAVEIYNLRSTMTAKQVAERFHISPHTVYDIWHGKRWGHVTKDGSK